MKPALAPSPPVLFDDADAQRAVRHVITRYFFGTAAVVALLAALVFVFLPSGIAPGARWPLVLAFAALGALAATSMRAGATRMEDLVALVVIAAIAVITLAVTLLDWGIAGPGFGFFGLMTCMVCRRRRAAPGPAGGRAERAGGAGLAYAQYRQWLPAGNSAMSDESLGLRALIHLIVIGSGLAGGLLVSRVVSGFVRSAEEREQRFRGLLTIAADAYWEIDDQYRLVTFKRQGRAGGSMGEASAIGQVPWEVPEFSLDEDTLDLLRAHLEAREPFRDLPVQWLGVPGQVRHFLVSGEPRQPAQAAFMGYWGVARDVSADVQARQALVATESRYLELFTRIPTPLVLHAQGRVLDANPAALDMFGFADLQAMVGQDLLAVYEGGDSRERARRGIEALQQMDAGEALPVAEFRLSGREGRRVVVRATGVRLDTPDGPAVLSIFVDDTERKKAEDAVRRSEAMLSHLVATSPDVITLTDLATGRYAMVNRTFERQTGYSAAEVVGRTSIGAGHLAPRAGPRAFRRRHPRPGPGAGHAHRVRHQERRHAVDAGVGRALRDGPARVPGDQRARRHRGRARAPAARGDPAERVDRHRRHARPALRARQPALRADVRLAGRRAARPERARGLGQRRRLPAHRRHARAGAGARRIGGDRDPGAALRRQHLPGARHRQGHRPLAPGRAAAPSGSSRTSPSGARSSRRWRARATPPRPPTAPRAPSWPTPATSCARR